MLGAGGECDTGASSTLTMACGTIALAPCDCFVAVRTSCPSCSHLRRRLRADPRGAGRADGGVSVEPRRAARGHRAAAAIAGARSAVVGAVRAVAGRLPARRLGLQHDRQPAGPDARPRARAGDDRAGGRVDASRLATHGHVWNAARRSRAGDGWTARFAQDRPWGWRFPRSGSDSCCSSSSPRGSAGCRPPAV